MAGFENLDLSFGDRREVGQPRPGRFWAPIPV